VGRALAEIHRRRFPQAGFLDADLAVRTPFTDVFDAFTAYAASELDRAAVESDLRARLDAFLTAHRTLLQRMTDPPVLLQGDFKVSNLLWTTDERLLVLDWEFAYSGPALMDIGQLLRWDPSASFVSGFADSYRRHGGVLLEGWQRAAEVFDLINLIGLLGGAEPGSRQSIDVRHRIEQTLGRRVGDFA
jgi:aminoglycoside phosphotransferase (APT) family kinase protein